VCLRDQPASEPAKAELQQTVTTHPLKEEGFRQLLDAAPDAMAVVDPRGNVLVVNRKFEQLFGWGEAELLGEPLSRLFPARFRPAAEAQDVSARADPKVPVQDATVSLFGLRRDGREFPAEFSRSPVGERYEAPALVTIRDLSKWRLAQETLFREKEQAFVTLASIADAVITTDLAGRITYLNPTAERLTGWRTTEGLGQPLDSVLTLISEATRQAIESIPVRCLREGRAVDLADGVLMLRRDGTEVAVGDSAAPLRDRNGVTIGVVLVFHDVSEKRRTSRILSYEATHDALTGLVSRREFERRLTLAIAEAAPGAAEHALCYLDLDQFKLVNDVCGHEAGDDLLRTIAGLLVDRLRNCDTVGRLGGDEFGVLLDHCTLPKAQEIAAGLVEAIGTRDYVSEAKGFSVRASVGLVPVTAAAGRAADLLRVADDACFAAKDSGGDRVQVGRSETAPGVQQPAESRRIARLLRAVEEGQFQLYAQPIARLADEGPARPRCEILLRLPDGHGGMESADLFLAQAERHRMIPAIDRWVVRQTIGLVAQWHRDHPECELPVCSINLSVSSLNDADLVPVVRELLAEHRLPPDALCFEITEAAALGSFAQLVRLISELREVGCGIGLDDFGSGLTSFAHLKALTVDFVKIGGHYVRGVVEDPVYGTLVTAVNEIGRIMGIATIADEVETEPILDRLRALGVGFAQGHIVGPPVPLVHAEGSAPFPCVPRSV
jgi:diguanylate cyclase (GGDEF)-like protein/PAS domain S-box-containing protein